MPSGAGTMNTAKQPDVGGGGGGGRAALWCAPSSLPAVSTMSRLKGIICGVQPVSCASKDSFGVMHCFCILAQSKPLHSDVLPCLRFAHDDWNFSLVSHSWSNCMRLPLRQARAAKPSLLKPVLRCTGLYTINTAVHPSVTFSAIIKHPQHLVCVWGGVHPAETVIPPWHGDICTARRYTPQCITPAYGIALSLDGDSGTMARSLYDDQQSPTPYLKHPPNHNKCSLFSALGIMATARVGLWVHLWQHLPVASKRQKRRFAKCRQLHTCSQQWR